MSRGTLGCMNIIHENSNMGGQDSKEDRILELEQNVAAVQGIDYYVHIWSPYYRKDFVASKRMRKKFIKELLEMDGFRYRGVGWVGIDLNGAQEAEG